MRRIPVVAATLLGLTLFGGFARADEIKLLQPSGGTFDAGSTVLIRWDYSFLEAMPRTAAEKLMRIELMHFAETGASGHGGGTAWTLDRTIADVDVLSTQYAWKVPSLVGGSNQVIRIRMLNRPALTATSVPFTIHTLKPSMPRMPFRPLTIAVTSPEAGKTYYIGDKVTIAWSKALIQNDGTVWLFVCWPDRTTCGGGYPVANTDAANTGVTNSASYDWTISEPEAHDLVIQVQGHDGSPRGFSGVFHAKKRIHVPRGVLVGPLKQL